MHELAITENILSIVIDKAKAVPAKKVTKINVTIGEMTGVVADCVQFYFDFLSKDTVAGATLEFETPSAKLRCRNCQTTYSPNDLDWACPNCRQQKAEIVSGRECFVNSIEVDE